MHFSIYMLIRALTTRAISLQRVASQSYRRTPNHGNVKAIFQIRAVFACTFAFLKFYTTEGSETFPSHSSSSLFFSVSFQRPNKMKPPLAPVCTTEQRDRQFHLVPLCFRFGLNFGPSSWPLSRRWGRSDSEPSLSMFVCVFLIISNVKRRSF